MADDREALRPAEFAEVTPRRAAPPSWMVRQPAESGRQRHSERPGLAPGRLPSEFVSAVRRELSVAPPARARGSQPPPGSSETGGERRSTRPPEHDGSVAKTPAEPVIPPELVAGFRDAIEQLVAARAGLLEQTAGQLAELAAVIARRVIAHELSLSPAILNGLVREALDVLGEDERVRVRIGRGFAVAAEGLEAQLGHRGVAAEVVVDPALGDYACEVETEYGSVDETVERRLEKLLGALKPDSERP